jgi:hypothetical protein
MRRRGFIAAVLGKLQATGFAPAESAFVLMSAVNNMCIDAKQVVAGLARDNGYTGTGVGVRRCQISTRPSASTSSLGGKVLRTHRQSSRILCKSASIAYPQFLRYR